MDIEARTRYPQWTTGEKVTMISIPVANARERVAAMDRHVRQLEKRLGRTTAWPIRWVRGPLLGLDGKAPFSVCMGSRPHDAELGTDGLAAVDRHEVAHCVITSLNSYESDPPAVLAEGWAEANQGTDSTEQVFRAWSVERAVTTSHSVSSPAPIGIGATDLRHISKGSACEIYPASVWAGVISQPLHGLCLEDHQRGLPRIWA